MNNHEHRNNLEFKQINSAIQFAKLFINLKYVSKIFLIKHKVFKKEKKNPIYPLIIWNPPGQIPLIFPLPLLDLSDMTSTLSRGPRRSRLCSLLITPVAFLNSALSRAHNCSDSGLYPQFWFWTETTIIQPKRWWFLGSSSSISSIETTITALASSSIHRQTQMMENHLPLPPFKSCRRWKSRQSANNNTIKS